MGSGLGRWRSMVAQGVRVVGEVGGGNGGSGGG